jgi:DNA-binding transcriptional LysR family regulator
VRSVSLPPRDLRMAMTDGAIDLAIGYFMEFDGENFFSQKLFEQTFVCLARTDHPVTGNVITLEQFAQADHAVVEQEGRSQEVFERHLASLGIERRIVLRSPHFMSVPLLIARSDVIATVPLAVARIYTQIIGLKMLALPFRSPSVDLKQFWHRRSHGDPGTIWLRRLVAELFIGTDPTAGGRSPFWRSFAEALPNASRHGG